MTRGGSRTTFLTVGQTLERAERRCGEIARVLARAAGEADDERVAITRDALEHQQERLCQALASYRSRAPGEVLATYLQYTPEFGELPHPIAADTVDELTASARSLGEQLEAALRAVAEAAETDAVGDVFRAAADLVRAELEQTSREAQEVRDL